MPARYILFAFALVFAAGAGYRFARDGSVGSQGRTWLIVAAIFTLVGGWLLVSP
jgi:hypothetical protein